MFNLFIVLHRLHGALEPRFCLPLSLWEACTELHRKRGAEVERKPLGVLDTA